MIVFAAIVAVLLFIYLLAALLRPNGSNSKVIRI